MVIKAKEEREKDMHSIIFFMLYLYVNAQWQLATSTGN